MRMVKVVVSQGAVMLGGAQVEAGIAAAARVEEGMGGVATGRATAAEEGELVGVAMAAVAAQEVEVEVTVEATVMEEEAMGCIPVPGPAEPSQSSTHGRSGREWMTARQSVPEIRPPTPLRTLQLLAAR